ncbi:DNA polymerase III subunit epsilon [Mycobacterium tuberculosis]|uniref:DNA polymerase III subunit epsilon n=1 Tax=Mycobacterium tuberculosis TaxID=1773 RepID=A0A654T876_MYCTX|nr:DNA polymerase III subunit epsilon [Mycobacterium tuberculosis]CFE49077.1 DNA polymerase III subunit epsilon [Mycobacterium tuberculosis]COZ42285.1 DNA polymerase III subunit epsilon [Mycobacterium tuberculosis]
MVCNATAPEHGKGYHALQLGVPVMPEARFMECIGAVVGGASVEDFTDVAPVEKQLALF